MNFTAITALFDQQDDVRHPLPHRTGTRGSKEQDGLTLPSLCATKS